MNVGTLINRAAERFGSRVALEGPDGTRSFAEVGAHARQLARALRAAGLRPGDRVLDLQTNQCTCVESDFGIATAGMCRVALNYRLKPADWLKIAVDSGARALIYDARFADSVPDLCDVVEYSIVIGEDERSQCWDDVLERFSPSFFEVSVESDALVSLNYSSGTTGAPKGAQRTHRNRLASLSNIVVDIYEARMDSRTIWCHAGPMTHASGLFVLPHFCLGAQQLILPEWSPGGFVEAVRERGATGSVLVPTMLTRLLGHPELTPEDMSGLCRLAYAGAPMPPTQIREVLERVTPKLLQFYGLVEAIPPLTVLGVADHERGVSEPDLLASAGRPCLGVELRIVDKEGTDLARGEVGEVITRGDHVMKSYFATDGSAESDATKAVVNDWLHTGDLGSIDADGYLYLVDRKGDMIISGGYNIYPREIEDVIAEMPGIEEAAVVGVEDMEWGQRLVAFCRVAPEASVSAEAVVSYCGDRLAAYKKPKDVIMVESFPMSSTGKIAKKELRTRMESTRAMPWGS